MNALAVHGSLPDWTSVLVVVAHPDDESFGLGAVIDAFVSRGSRVSVLCFTHGEASTLHGVEGDLGTIRELELTAAAAELRIDRVRLASYADGGLADVPLDELAALVVDVAQEVDADGLLGFDLSGVTGHPDHVRATEAAMAAGAQLAAGVLGWTLPSDVLTVLAAEYGVAFAGHEPAEIDVVLRVPRERQLVAVTRHPSQAVPGSVLRRRLELLGDREHLRLQAVTQSPGERAR